jgi:hypothetical protein
MPFFPGIQKNISKNRKKKREFPHVPVLTETPKKNTKKKNKPDPPRPGFD